MLIEYFGNLLIIDDLRGFIELKKEVGGFHNPSKFANDVKYKYNVEGLLLYNLRDKPFRNRIYNNGVIYNIKKIKLLTSNV